MWDLLELLVGILFDLPWEFADLTGVWRFPVAVFVSYGAAALIHWLLGAHDYHIPAALVGIGVVAGVYWEARSRMK